MKRLTRRRLRKATSLISKRLRWLLATPGAAVPVFVFGKQRSGTTMLMDVFHARRDTVVFDERANSRAFLDYRVRNLAQLERIVNEARAPFICFKPLADSHRIHEFLSRFPGARAIWIYRHYASNALSSLRKWPDGRRAIRLVCTGQTGGGWFQEGVSEETGSVLREVYTPALAEMDLACLVWWARNRLAIELELLRHPRVLLIRYEDLLGAREPTFGQLFDFIGMTPDAAAFRDVGRVGTTVTPPATLHPVVERMCANLLAVLDEHRSKRERRSVRSTQD